MELVDKKHQTPENKSFLRTKQRRMERKSHDVCHRVRNSKFVKIIRSKQKIFREIVFDLICKMIPKRKVLFGLKVLNKAFHIINKNINFYVRCLIMFIMGISNFPMLIFTIFIMGSFKSFFGDTGTSYLYASVITYTIWSVFQFYLMNFFTPITKEIFVKFKTYAAIPAAPFGWFIIYPWLGSSDTFYRFFPSLLFFIMLPVIIFSVLMFFFQTTVLLTEDMKYHEKKKR